MSETIRFIGDIHGKNQSYLKIVSSCKYSTIQVGDYGSGFVINPISPISTQPQTHRFIRGNHDNPATCKEQHNYISDGTIENHSGVKVGFIGGANSIDREWRTEGVDWWPDEQLSIQELNQILDKFSIEQPEVIISHECPEFVSTVLVEAFNGRKYIDDNRTRQMLEQLYYYYKPKLHIFGHWHYDFDWVYQGTRFICLNELSYIDVDFSDLENYDNSITSYGRM